MAEGLQRGKLKIFFGAFPGAGKTNAMLTAAQLMREAGRDVVVGVVDTHESANLKLLEGFETLPAPVRGAGPAPSELDLDGALARHPDVILIDDLAHANPEGARHPKRWKDADELLAAGIDVFTTMSVQHLESLNDVVGEITGIREPLTVPDTFFDTAEETVMVDMSADELLVRKGEGKVHVGEAEKSVEQDYFSKGSLLALREIALRRTADVVEHEVQKYRAETGVDVVWKTQGRLLCCVGPRHGAEHVVRSAARFAKRLAVPWTAIYVETSTLQRLPVDERRRILSVVRLAEELGANTAIVTGNDVAQAIVDYTREQNIATVVVGKTRRAWLKHGMSERIASRAGSLDLIEIGRSGAGAGVAVEAPAPRPADPDDSRKSEKRLRYLWTVVACAGATLFSTSLYPSFELATIAMIYTITVVLLAVRFGRGPAIVGAAINVLAFKFFFVAPRYGLIPTDIQYLLTFAVMLAVGVLIGQLAGRLRFQARVAAHREKRARTLYEFARDLAQMQSPAQVIETTEDFLERQFRARAAVMVPDTAGMLFSPTGRGMTNPLDSTAAQWAYDQGQPAGAGTDTLATNEYLFLPLKSPSRMRGVLAIRAERARDLFIPEQRHQFEIFATLVATALERVHYADVARNALLMAGLHSGEVALERERRGMADLVDAAMRALGPAMGKHQVDIQVSRDLPQVAVDPALVHRMLVSVIGNAAKHTPAGTQVNIAAKALPGGVELAVEDNGPGWPKGREEEVFESFARGESQGNRRGAGLGLAISRAIVEAHGGKIRAEAREGGGARLVLTFPFAAAPRTSR
jgi:two-component system, OmpR family, sensor histidine kinase KdpD